MLNLRGRPLRQRRRGRLPATLSLLGLSALVLALAPLAAQAAPGCRVTYQVTPWNDGGGGFTASVTITNTGDPVSGWTLAFAFPSASQRLTAGWSATWSQSGQNVTARSLDWNANLATGASASIGFNGTGGTAAPTAFTVNGTACTTSGGTTSTSGSTTSSSTTTTRPATTTTQGGGGGGGGQAGLVGWATVNGTTTGGGNAAPVTVTSASAFIAAAESSSPAVIRVSGMIALPDDMVDVASNKTIIGVGSGSGFTGGGLNVDEASNVIIRNLNFRDWPDDAINVQYSHHVWIDHNSFSNGNDGAVDIKRSSDFVTVSWNHFFDHDKTMLLGHDDGNAGEDRGRLRVTYHHNWFDGTNQRHPRVRFGNPVHVFNNYYASIGDYGVASTMEAGVLVEGNYFENTDSPCELGQGDSPPGSLVARNNVFVNSGACQAGGSVASIPYPYTLENPSNVRASVMAGAGAGRISA